MCVSLYADLNAYGSLGYKPVASPVYPSSKPDPVIGNLSYYRSGDQHQHHPQQAIPPPTPVAIPVTMAQTSGASTGGNTGFMDGSMNEFSPYQQFNHTFQLNDSLTQQQTSSAAAAAAAVAAMHHPHQQHHQPLYNQHHPHATGHVMMPPQWQQQQHHHHQQQQHMRRGSYQQPTPHPSMYRAPPASPYQQPYYAAPAPMGTPSPTTAAAAMMNRYHPHPQHHQQQHQLQQMQGQMPLDMNQKKRKGMEDFGELAVPKKKTRAKKKRVKEPVDPNAPPKPKRKTGLNKPLILSPELSAFVGGDPEVNSGQNLCQWELLISEECRCLDQIL